VGCICPFFGVTLATPSRSNLLHFLRKSLVYMPLDCIYLCFIMQYWCYIIIIVVIITINHLIGVAKVTPKTCHLSYVAFLHFLCFKCHWIAFLCFIMYSSLPCCIWYVCDCNQHCGMLNMAGARYQVSPVQQRCHVDTSTSLEKETTWHTVTANFKKLFEI